MRMASATSTTLFIAFTSWTRTICAPFKMLAVTAAAVANSVSDLVFFSKKDLREGPPSTVNRAIADHASLAMISRVLFATFSETQARINNNLMFLNSCLARAIVRRFQINCNRPHQVLKWTQSAPTYRAFPAYD